MLYFLDHEKVGLIQGQPGISFVSDTVRSVRTLQYTSRETFIPTNNNNNGMVERITLLTIFSRLYEYISVFSILSLYRNRTDRRQWPNGNNHDSCTQSDQSGWHRTDIRSNEQVHYPQWAGKCCFDLQVRMRLLNELLFMWNRCV